jgi:hypothetical protein
MMLIAIAWLYVAFMVAVVEATSSQGTLLGAAFTFLLYGVLPVAILSYLMLSPARRRARRAVEPGLTDRTADRAPPSAPTEPLDPDRRGHPPGRPVAAERIEP